MLLCTTCLPDSPFFKALGLTLFITTATCSIVAATAVMRYPAAHLRLTPSTGNPKSSSIAFKGKEKGGQEPAVFGIKLLFFFGSTGTCSSTLGSTDMTTAQRPFDVAMEVMKRPSFRFSSTHEEGKRSSCTYSCLLYLVSAREQDQNGLRTPITPAADSARSTRKKKEKEASEGKTHFAT